MHEPTTPRASAPARDVRRSLALLAALAVSLAACRKAARVAPPAARPAAAVAAPSALPAPVPENFGLRPAERKAVEDFLRRHTDLRLPGEADRSVSASGDGDVRHLYGVYHPYFVRGDLNDDGILDFVMGFVRRDSDPDSPSFTVVVFPGREDRPGGPTGFAAEIPLETDVGLAAGDLSIDRDAIVITPDLDDDTTRRYRWDPTHRSYVFVGDDESDVDAPETSRA